MLREQVHALWTIGVLHRHLVSERVAMLLFGLVYCYVAIMR